MANVTIYEYFDLPDANGYVLDGAYVENTVAIGTTYNLRDQTVFIYVCSDTDCRIGFANTAVASGRNILSAIANGFRLRPGPNRSLNTL